MSGYGLEGDFAVEVMSKCLAAKAANEDNKGIQYSFT